MVGGGVEEGVPEKWSKVTPAKDVAYLGMGFCARCVELKAAET